MSTTNEPAFDWSQASSLLGDDPSQVADDMAEIVRELVEGADVQFQELKMKNAETDRKAISALAHGLRGCLLNFGFTEVGAILVQVEKGTYTAELNTPAGSTRPRRSLSPPRKCSARVIPRSSFPDFPAWPDPFKTGSSRERARRITNTSCRRS